MGGLGEAQTQQIRRVESLERITFSRSIDLTKIKDALDHARSEAQELHKQVEANTARDHAALKADLVKAGAKAQQLANSLKSAVDGQRSDAAQHIKDATKQLEDAAKHTHDVADASASQLKDHNKALLSKIHSAAQSLSHAVASTRSNAVAK
jgi:hypothetical protein